MAAGSHDSPVDERISFKEVYARLVNWIWVLIRKWKHIVIGTIVIAALFATYRILKKRVYTAQTTFVLENSSSRDLGRISSIAGIAGVNLGPLSDADPLFQINNIMELYRSRRMLTKTFLTQILIDGVEERLITRFAREKKLLRKWRNKSTLHDIDFEVPLVKYTIKHDSLLSEVIRDFREKQLTVEKIDRRMSILSVMVRDKDEQFAKSFNEQLVQNVNTFYLRTKTKKTAENLRVLQQQADSVKRELDQTLLELAALNEELPNLNPFHQRVAVPLQKAQIEVETTSAVYEEIVRNLEIAKITHRNNTPLIQIIDEPLRPLPHNKMKILKLMVLSLILGGVIMVSFFTAKHIFSSLLED